MSLAPELTLRVSTRPVGAADPATATVMHAIGGRSEAVRLTSVIAALGAAGVPQRIARVVGPDDGDHDLIDATGTPRMDLLVDRSAASEIQRTAGALALAERALEEQPPALLVLGGHEDSTLAFALAAAKLGVPIARVGAGLRCGDFSLSEEINAILGDRLAELLFVDDHAAADALQAEGIPERRVHVVGNSLVDLVRQHEPRARTRAAWRRFGLARGAYVLATLHRSWNLLDSDRVARITEALIALARRTPVIMPIHPRAHAVMHPTGQLARLHDAGVRLTAPLGFVDFLSLEQSATAIVTDSGSVQDEASVLGVPCYTLLWMTDRASTLTHGTNVLLGEDVEELAGIPLEAREPVPAAIPLWDGRAAARIADVVKRRLAAPARA